MFVPDISMCLKPVSGAVGWVGFVVVVHVCFILSAILFSSSSFPCVLLFDCCWYLAWVGITLGDSHPSWFCFVGCDVISWAVTEAGFLLWSPPIGCHCVWECPCIVLGHSHP